MFQLLETQQQLAVAISTDKRKDIMIEQLDKVLVICVMKYCMLGNICAV